MKRLSLLILLLCLSLSIIATASVSAQNTNLLTNSSFESEAYTYVSTDPLAQGVIYSVPSGWGGGVIQSPRSEPWMNVHPTGFPHTGPYRYDGFRSFHMARGGGTFTAYLYQQVAVQAGTPLQGGAYSFIENGSGTSVTRVGIDPTGGTNPFGGAVVWSPWAGNGFNWNQMVVNSNAIGNTVTLFLYATQTAPVDPNGIYWDAAFLNGTAGTPTNNPAPAQPSGAQVAQPRVRLNVRSGAGTNFDRIGLIRPGESYTVLSQQGAWVQIDYNGQSAYVSAQYVNITGGTSGGNAPSGEAQPTGITLNYTLWYTLQMRSGPGRSFGTVGTIPFESTVQVVGRSGDGNWLQVNYNGQSGWVAGWYGRLSGGLRSLPVTG